MALREGHYEEEGWRIRKDGSRFWANVLITAVFNEAGEHIGFAKVTRDTTERRQALEERDRAAQALPQPTRSWSPSTGGSSRPRTTSRSSWL